MLAECLRRSNHVGSASVVGSTYLYGKPTSKFKAFACSLCWSDYMQQQIKKMKQLPILPPWMMIHVRTNCQQFAQEE